MRSLREYRPTDASQVWSLHERALLATGAHAGHGPWDDDLQRIDEIYVKPGGCFYVLEESGVVIAMGALKRHPRSQGEIKRMRVEPSYQRQGLGQLILDRLLQEAMRREIRRLFLDTTDRQVAAQKLYEKNGFSEYQRREGKDMTTIFYERNAEPSAATNGASPLH